MEITNKEVRLVKWLITMVEDEYGEGECLIDAKEMYNNMKKEVK